MFAVIFKAEIKQLDHTYFESSTRMRELAISDYGCKEFSIVTEGNREIAISYWDNEEQIILWKQDPEHLVVQELARTRWYRSYKVEIVEIRREYSS